MNFGKRRLLVPALGSVFIILWLYLTFFSYPSVLWVKNTDVFEKNLDTYIDFSNSVEDFSGYDVIVLPPESPHIEKLMGEDKNLLLTGESDEYKDGCNRVSEGRVCVVTDGIYEYSIFYLSGREILFYLRQVAFLFLLAGIVMLRKVFMDGRFHILIIFLFALLGMRKYIIGLPLTYDLPFYTSCLWMGSKNVDFMSSMASGMPIEHYYPPLYYNIFSGLVPLLGVLNTLKFSIFAMLFLSGLSAYFFIPRIIKKYDYAVVSAVMYMLFPFMLFNINIRGGLQESFTLILVPAIFYFLKRSLEEKENKYLVGFSLSYFLVIVNHIPSTIIISFSLLVVTLFSRDLSKMTRVFKGMRMAGRTGGEQVMAISLRVMKIIPEENILIVKGSVPGSNGSYLIITK